MTKEERLQRNREKARRWRQLNPEKSSAMSRRYYAANSAKACENAKKWRLANPEKAREYSWVKHGVSVQEAYAALENHTGYCDCCGTKEPGKKGWYVDHCHDTGKVRGILCFNCNSGIGHLGDNLEGIQKGIEYLLRHQNGLIHKT